MNNSRMNSFFIAFFYKKVGEDAFFNKYYASKKLDYLGRNKRFIVYKGESEPAKIPPMWHAWLHHMINEVPHINNFPWQKNHLLNTASEDKIVNSSYNRWKP